MHQDLFVVDATVHGFNFLPENYSADFVADLVQMLYQGAHRGFHPHGTERYNLQWNEFLEAFHHQPGLLPETLFGESETDVIVYHGVPMEGIYVDGSSPIWVAQEARKRHPDRVYIYGPLYPWHAGAIDEIDRLVDEVGVIGIKFYPVDLIEGELRASRMDTDAAMRCIEHMQRRGLRMVAVHKAVPLGPLPLAPYGSMYDMAAAVEAFPDMTFEIVHGGAAFVDETVRLLERHANVAINLECLPGFINHPGMVGEWVALMSAFLDADAEDRMFYASGAVGGHPQAYLQAFLDFEMPAGHPPLTPAIKEKMLGLNFARHHGWDVSAIKAKLACDRFGLHRPLAEPWSWLREQRRQKAESA